MSTPRHRGTNTRKKIVVAVVAGGLAGGSIATGLMYAGTSNDTQPAADTTTSSSPAAATTAAPTQDPQVTATLLRGAFLAQALADRGYERFYGSPDNVPGIASNTCASISQNPTSAGVWTAAANLEEGPFAFEVTAAWDTVDLISTVWCPDVHAVVLETIGAIS